MTAPLPQSQPTPEPVRQDAPWELHRQDDYADHEFSFWQNGEIVVLANPAFGRDDALQTMVDCLNSHASLKARAEQAERSVDVLESNAREQAKLLADTGRRVEELEAALRVILAKTEGERHTVNEQNIFKYWGLLNLMMIEIRDIARAALRLSSTPEVSR